MLKEFVVRNQYPERGTAVVFNQAGTTRNYRRQAISFLLVLEGLIHNKIISGKLTTSLAIKISALLGYKCIVSIATHTQTRKIAAFITDWREVCMAVLPLCC
jgi:hypothetical protein